MVQDICEVSNSESISLVNYGIIPEGTDISPNTDGGLFKAIKKEGDKSSLPLKGNKIFCHYEGKFTDGTVFDSSKQRNEQFSFLLGKGQVISAWDIALATMSCGEVSTITCSPHYGYGALGQPPKIPGDSVLIFDIELIRFEEEDLSPNKNGSILRSQLFEGQGHKLPNPGALCEVCVVGRYQNRIFEEREFSCCLDDNDLIAGLNIALKKFKQGERSRLTIGPEYAFGKTGNEKLGIPPDATIQYEVVLKNFEKAKEVWEMDGEEKLDQSEVLKKKGNDLFKQSKLKDARLAYEKVLTYLQTDAGMDEKEKERRDALLLAAHLNVAMCCLKSGEHRNTVNHCDKALALDPKSEKALYRRGMAYIELQELVKAIDDLKAVISIDADNSAAKQGLATAQLKYKQIKEKEKKTYAGMFQKFANIDSKKDAPARREDVFTDVNMWNNDLASGMMTLEQEAEAFGETPPAPRYNQPGGGLDDDGEEKENENPANRDDDDF